MTTENARAVPEREAPETSRTFVVDARDDGVPRTRRAGGGNRQALQLVGAAEMGFRRPSTVIRFEHRVQVVTTATRTIPRRPRCRSAAGAVAEGPRQAICDSAAIRDA